jgi:hypothetical protein
MHYERSLNKICSHNCACGASTIHGYTSISKIVQDYSLANIDTLANKRKISSLDVLAYSQEVRECLVVNAKNCRPCYFMLVICFDTHTSPRFLATTGKVYKYNCNQTVDLYQTNVTLYSKLPHLAIPQHIATK